jgi:DNA-nicking Smr family endonuclease
MTRRRLSEEERTLWQGVIRSIAPLRRRFLAEPEPGPDVVPPKPAKVPAKSKLLPPVVAPPPKPAAPPLVPLGRRLRKRVARGSHAIDGRLDLHGLTQAEAHHALLHFLHRTHAHGGGLVLVITGKGVLGGDHASERGVLKRQVPLWLRLPEFRNLIVGFESASSGHGGEGALYIRLRRPRE